MVRALLDELIIVGGVAAAVVSYNAILVNGWEDLALIHHEPLFPTQNFPLMYLPLTGFTLSSSALSLLLGTLCDVDVMSKMKMIHSLTIAYNRLQYHILALSNC